LAAISPQPFSMVIRFFGAPSKRVLVSHYKIRCGFTDRIGNLYWNRIPHLGVLFAKVPPGKNKMIRKSLESSSLTNRDSAVLRRVDDGLT